MFHRWRSLLTALAALALALPATARGAEQTYVSIAGDGNTIDGPSRLYTTADSSISMISGNDGGGLEAARVELQRGDQNWTLWFVAADGRPLVPGIYDDAIDPGGSSFGPGRNGISVSGEGQGCSSSGRF